MKLLATLAAAVLALAPVSAHADAWDNFNAYLAGQPGIANVVTDGSFALDRTEFGANGFQQAFHAGIEYLIATQHGFTVIYIAPKAGKPYVAAVFADAGPAFKGRTIYATDHCTLLSGKPALGVPAPGGGCMPADTLVGNAGGVVQISGSVDAVAAVARDCSIHVNTVGHDHSC